MLSWDENEDALLQNLRYQKKGFAASTKLNENHNVIIQYNEIIFFNATFISFG